MKNAVPKMQSHLLLFVAGEMVGLEFCWALWLPREALSDSQVLPSCFEIQPVSQINECSTDYKIFVLDAKWWNFKNSLVACWNMFQLVKLALIHYNSLGHPVLMFLTIILLHSLGWSAVDLSMWLGTSLNHSSAVARRSQGDATFGTHNYFEQM